jgi:hypothetical protein
MRLKLWVPMMKMKDPDGRKTQNEKPRVGFVYLFIFSQNVRSFVQ